MWNGEETPVYIFFIYGFLTDMNIGIKFYVQCVKLFVLLTETIHSPFSRSAYICYTLHFTDSLFSLFPVDEKAGDAIDR